jgi:hypothetical protein
MLKFLKKAKKKEWLILSKDSFHQSLFVVSVSHRVMWLLHEFNIMDMVQTIFDR